MDARKYLTFDSTFRPTTIASQKLRKEMFLFAFAAALLGLYTIVFAAIELPFFVAEDMNAFRFRSGPSWLPWIGWSGWWLLLGAVFIVAGRFLKELCRRLKDARDWGLRAVWVLETLLMFALAVAAAGLLYSFLRRGAHGDFYSQAEAVFSAYRYTSLASGVSPMVPLFFAAAAVLFSLFASIRRMVLLERMGSEDDSKNPAEPPKYLDFGVQVQSLKPTAQIEGNLYRLLARSSLESLIGLILVVAVFVCWRFTFFKLSDSVRLAPSIEGQAFDWLFALLVLVVYCDIVLGFYRFLKTWNEFKRLLQMLSWHPLANHFKAFADSTPLLSRLWIMAEPPSLGALALSLREATDLLKSHSSGDMQTAQHEFSLATLAHAQSDDRNALAHAAKVRVELQKYGQQLASLMENAHWPAPPSRPGSGDEAAKQPKAADAEIDRLMLAGRFLTSRVVEYCRHILAHLGNLVTYNTASLFMLLFAVSWYPFARDDSLLRLNWVFVLGAVSIAIFVSVQVSRNKVLSLLSGGRPDEIDWNWDFVKYLLVYAALPVLGFVGLRPPSTLHGFYSWLSGLLSSGH